MSDNTLEQEDLIKEIISLKKRMRVLEALVLLLKKIVEAL